MDEFVKMLGDAGAVIFGVIGFIMANIMLVFWWWLGKKVITWVGKQAKFLTDLGRNGFAYAGLWVVWFVLLIAAVMIFINFAGDLLGMFAQGSLNEINEASEVIEGLDYGNIVPSKDKPGEAPVLPELPIPGQEQPLPAASPTTPASEVPQPTPASPPQSGDGKTCTINMTAGKGWIEAARLVQVTCGVTVDYQSLQAANPGGLNPGPTVLKLP